MWQWCTFAQRDLGIWPRIDANECRWDWRALLWTWQALMHAYMIIHSWWSLQSIARALSWPYPWQTRHGFVQRGGKDQLLAKVIHVKQPQKALWRLKCYACVFSRYWLAVDQCRALCEGRYTPIVTCVPVNCGYHLGTCMSDWNASVATWGITWRTCSVVQGGMMACSRLLGQHLQHHNVAWLYLEA